MSATEELLDEALTTGEEIMDALEESSQLTGKHLLIVGALGGAIGGVAAYFIGNHFLKAKYEKIAEEEIAQAKEYYKILHKEGNYETPEKAVSTLASPEEEEEVKVLRMEAAQAHKEYQEGVIPHPVAEVVEEEQVNVFMQSHVDENFNLDEEMQNRSPDEPYVISQEEFMLNENGYSQDTITYYAGDGALADEKDQEIPLIDPIVGEENLERFGHGSGDSRTVFIRNERLSTDFEVVMSDGKYAHEVLGLEHSDGGFQSMRQSTRSPKFRDSEG